MYFRHVLQKITDNIMTDNDILSTTIKIYYNCFTTPWTLSGTTWVSRYQKGKTNLDLLEQEIVNKMAQSKLKWPPICLPMTLLLLLLQPLYGPLDFV